MGCAEPLFRTRYRPGAVQEWYRGPALRRAWPSRHARIDDLSILHMGVRVDREGRLERDYHTALNVRKASGGLKDCEPSTRYYLADACFLVGLESDDGDLLIQLHDALCNPVWPLYLGRKAFVPGEPIWLSDGPCEGGRLLDALQAYEDLCNNAPARRRFIIEDPHGDEVRPDQPISFAERRFAPRRVSTSFITIPREEPHHVPLPLDPESDQPPCTIGNRASL